MAARNSAKLSFKARKGLRSCSSSFAFSNWSLMAFRSAGLNCAESDTFLLFMSVISLFIVLVVSVLRSLKSWFQLSEAIRREAASLLNSACSFAFICAIIAIFPCFSASTRCAAYVFIISVCCCWYVLYCCKSWSYCSFPVSFEYSARFFSNAAKAASATCLSLLVVALANLSVIACFFHA